MFSTWAYSPYLHDYASEGYYQQGFKENNDVVKEVAASQQIPLFDFAEVMPQDAEYWADGRHVNEAGALVKARLFAEFIHAQGLIEQQFTPAPLGEARRKPHESKNSLLSYGCSFGAGPGLHTRHGTGPGGDRRSRDANSIALAQLARDTYSCAWRNDHAPKYQIGANSTITPNRADGHCAIPGRATLPRHRRCA